MAEKWKNFKMMETKRDINKRKDKPKNIVKADQLTVQRLSTNVSGKAKKYSRIGPREFVPYRKDDITFEGIKVPDLKLIRIRFVSKPASAISDDEEYDFPSMQMKKRNSIEGMIWSTLPEKVEFKIEAEAFGEGGFRQAFKATSTTPSFSGKWVIKRVKSVCKVEFGQVPAYCEVFLAKQDEEWVSVEPYIEGSSGYTLYDPEIASSAPTEGGEHLFCAGNLSNVAIRTFLTNHKCNYYCQITGLQNLKN
eukprot:gene21010-23062_t